MFESALERIYGKIRNDLSIKWKEWGILCLNDFGMTGAIFATVTAILLIMRWIEGPQSEIYGVTTWTYAVVSATLTAYKAGQTIEKLYNKAWNKMFPKNIVLPGGRWIK